MQRPGNQTTAAGGKPLVTFVQTDTNAFKEIVQRLTGPSENDPTQLAATSAAAAISKVGAGSKRSTSKLHERRHNLTRPKLEIVKPPINFKSNLTSPTSHSRSSSLHPSPVGTPSTGFSKLSLQEQENRGSELLTLPDLNSEEEEKAIKERRFYLHPSPRSRQGSTHDLPELLTLFPLTSTENEE
ncbi:VQ motif-containing protein 31 [Euphorbia lathyris]|uniref:VQ motif-containing protein 31 n=1 Tax=Euphorbia lathyris TaxID=212925 RepID=UPI003313369C